MLKVSIMSSFLIVLIFSNAAFSGEANIGQGRIYDIGTYVTDLHAQRSFIPGFSA